MAMAVMAPYKNREREGGNPYKGRQSYTRGGERETHWHYAAAVTQMSPALMHFAVVRTHITTHQGFGNQYPEA